MATNCATFISWCVFLLLWNSNGEYSSKKTLLSCRWLVYTPIIAVTLDDILTANNHISLVFVKQTNHEKLALNKSNIATTCQFLDLDMSLSHAKFNICVYDKTKIFFYLSLFS
jgi:hypothetical protein